MRTIREIVSDFVKFYSYFNEDYKNINLDDPIQFSVVFQKLISKVYEEKNGCFYFKKFILGPMEETGSGGIRWNSLFQRWFDIQRRNKGKYLSLLCSRSHGKTTFFSIIMTIYKAYIHKNYQQVIISASSTQSDLIIRDIRTIIENNELLFKLVDFKHWSTEFLAFNGGFIISRGIGAEIRGLHPHRVVLDDILRSDEKLSKDKIESYVFEDIIPAISPKNGDLVIVGTKKDATDIFSCIGEMIKDGATKWKFYKFPGILDFEKKITLAPDLKSFDELMEMKKTMGTLRFNKEILCEAIAEGSRIFDENLLELAKDKSLTYEDTPEKGASYYAGADLARSGSASADFTAVIFLKFIEAYNYMVVSEVYHKKGIKIRNQVKDVSLLCEKFNGAIILVEENNFGKDFIDLMAEEYNTAVEPIRTTDRTKEDIVRILITSFEQEKIKFPYMTDSDKRLTEAIFEELRHYIVKTTAAGNEKLEASGGWHDDLVDALGFALKCSRISGAEPGPLSKGSNDRGSELENMIDMGMIPERESMDGLDMPTIFFNNRRNTR